MNEGNLKKPDVTVLIIRRHNNLIRFSGENLNLFEVLVTTTHYYRSHVLLPYRITTLEFYYHAKDQRVTFRRFVMSEVEIPEKSSRYQFTIKIFYHHTGVKFPMKNTSQLSNSYAHNNIFIRNVTQTSPNPS